MSYDSASPVAAERLSTGAKAGYGVADFGMGLAFNLPAFFLLYYLTDVFAIPAVAAGLILFFTKIWDSLISPAMGYLSDYTVTRWGRKRPYLLYGALPAAFSIALVFWSPPIASTGWRILYSAGAFAMFCTCMTVMIIPYGALTADMTADPHERSVLSAYRMVFAIAGTLVGAGATRPLVVWLGGGTDAAAEALGFRVVGMVFGGVMALTVLVSFFSVRERTTGADGPRSLLWKDLGVIFHNRPFIILTLGVTMFQVALNTMSGVVVYYFKYNLNAEHMIPAAFLCLMASSVVSIPFFLWLSKTRGKKFSYNLGMAFMGALSVPIFIYSERSIPLTLALFTLVGLGLGTVYLSPWAMVPDTVEYSEWKTGLRREGILYGFFFFSYKLSVALPGLLVGTVLRMVGYVPNSAQSPAALLGIKSLLTLAPLGFVVIGIIIISRFPIDDEMYRRMTREIRERNNAAP